MQLPAPPTTRPVRLLTVSFLIISGLLSSVLTSTVSAQTAPRRCQIIGTPGPDVLVGTDGDDVICGLGGDDHIRGLGGNDEILGGDGNDRIFGDAGDDLLRGDGGIDTMFGGSGDDVIRGGGGDDNLVGGVGRDELRGGNENDSLAGGSGADVLRGGNGDDLARGAGGNDTVFGGPGHDIIKGGAGNDRLRGGPDDDICQDSFAKTNAINCEFGRGGDDRPVAVARQLWELRGDEEFVYAMTITKPCPIPETCGVSVFAETVHVRGIQATSSFGAPAFTDDELFDQAERAVDLDRKVAFHPRLGLPTLIDNREGGTLGVSDIDLRDTLRTAFDVAVATWKAAEVTDYAFTVTTSCFCPFTVPMRVLVSNGADVIGEPLAEGAPGWTGGVKTIEDHFADLEDVLDGNAIRVSAEFDLLLGAPLLVSVDESLLIADEERSVRISDFVQDETDDAPVEPEPVDVPDGEEPEGEPIEPQLPDGPTIVSVRGIQVSDQIADQVEALLAASDDVGLLLSGGGFRDPQRQIELRKKNCGTSDFAIFEMPANQCNPPTARPGRSQHELGLAIDFTSDGRLITSRSDTAFVWLSANAPGFGFINLPAEPWHWSTTGN